MYGTNNFLLSIPTLDISKDISKLVMNNCIYYYYKGLLQTKEN
jgi:hypothetical protein